jgi:hypothetical protein
MSSEGGALKKIAPSGGRGDNCWGIVYLEVRKRMGHIFFE